MGQFTWIGLDIRKIVYFVLKSIVITVFILLSSNCSDTKTDFSVNLEDSIDAVVLVGKNIEANTTGNIVSYRWEKDSEVLSQKAVFNTEVLPSGVHNITLTVEDSSGLAQSDSIMVRVYKLLYTESCHSTSDFIIFKYREHGCLDGSSSHQYEYDENGYLIKETTNSFHGGEQIRRLTYNEKNQLESISDNMTFQYDDEGNRRLFVYDTILPDNTSRYWKEEYSNDSKILSAFYKDENSENNTINITEHTYTYNENNELITRVQYTSTSISGNITESTEIQAFIYDYNAQLLLHNYDYDGDGVVDYTKTYEYNQNGKTVTSTYSKSKYSNEKYPDEKPTHILEYDKKDRVIRSSNLRNETLEINFTRKYLESENELIEEYDHGATGIVNISYTKQYDENGNLIMSAVDGDDINVADGEYDSVAMYRYDEQNNLVAKQNDDAIVTYNYTYDEHDVIIKTEENSVLKLEKSLY